MPEMRNTLLGLGALALVFGVAAVWLQGAGRGAAVLLLLLLGLTLAASASLPTAAAGRRLGGVGYEPPRQRRMRALHLLLLLLHVTGVIVVVFSAFVRFDWLAADFDARMLRLFPAALGAYLFLLALAADWRLQEGRALRHDWATKTHGWVLAFVSVPAIAAALVLIVRGGAALGVPLVEADILVLALVVLLGVGTQLFLVVGLPTSFDILRVFRPKAAEVEPGTPPVVHAVLFAGAVAALLAILLSAFDVFSQLGRFQDERVVLLLLVFPLGLAAFFLYSAAAVLRESRRGLYRKRLPARLRQDLVVYGLSGVAGIALAGVLAGVLTGRVERLGPMQADLDLAKDLIFLTILVTAAPVGVYLHRKNRRVDNIEARLPDFLNDLAENRRAGLTLAAALQSAARSDYGELSPEIRKMAHQVAWGVPFEEALEQLGQRVPTQLVQRSTNLVVATGRTGGSVAELLKAAARDAYEIKAMESERRVQMMTYLIVIYVVFMVFMLVIAVLDVQFLPRVLEANEAARDAGGQGFGADSDVDLDRLRFVYFNTAIVQAIGNGVVAGVLTEGRLTAGLRHIALMTTLAWVVFRFLGVF